MHFVVGCVVHAQTVLYGGLEVHVGVECRVQPDLVKQVEDAVVVEIIYLRSFSLWDGIIEIVEREDEISVVQIT